MGVPVGEWGSSLAADADSRLEYSRYVRQEAEARGLSWAGQRFGALRH